MGLKAGKGLTMVSSVLEGNPIERYPEAARCQEELKVAMEEHKVKGFSRAIFLSLTLSLSLLQNILFTTHTNQQNNDEATQHYVLYTHVHIYLLLYLPLYLAVVLHVLLTGVLPSLSLHVMVVISIFSYSYDVCVYMCALMPLFVVCYASSLTIFIGGSRYCCLLFVVCCC